MRSVRLRSPVVIAVVLASSASVAQDFDAVRYRELAAECDAFLARAETARDGGEAELAGRYLELGREACDQARALLGPFVSVSDLAPQSGALLQRGGTRVALLLDGGQCQPARELLGRIGALYERLPESATEGFGALTHRLLRCVPAEVELSDTPSLEVDAPEYGEVHLSPTAVAETQSGFALGAQTADRLAGDCTGFAANRPGHRLVLAAAATVELRLITPSAGALGLALVGDGQARCRSAGARALPVSMEATLNAGTYDVYVLEATPWGTGYELHFSARFDPPTALRPGPPGLGTLVLPDPTSPTFEGVTSPLAASVRRVGCPGLFHTRPDLVLEVTEPGRYGVMVVADRDTTLALEGDAVTYCSDDFSGPNPGVFQQLEAGRYEVFVGSWEASSPFAITIVSE